MSRKAIFFLVFFLLLGISFLSYYYYSYKSAPRELKVFGQPGHKVGSFSFLNQLGDTITDQDVRGKIRVVEYFFTTCEGICPKMNDNMSHVYQTFRGQNDLLILSHTVDPETDTVEQMKRYASKFDADPAQWLFLTGDKKELYEMAINSYLVTAVNANDTGKKVTPAFIHSEFFILVDPYDRVRGSYDGTKTDEVEELMDDIGELRREIAREESKQ